MTVWKLYLTATFVERLAIKLVWLRIFVRAFILLKILMKTDKTLLIL